MDEARKAERELNAAARRPRTFKIRIETKVDENSTDIESTINDYEWELPILALDSVVRSLNKIRRHRVGEIVVMPQVPEELKNEWDLVDGYNSEGFDLSVPPGFPIIMLDDHRALIGLIEWHPSVVCDRLIEVSLRMHMARRKEVKEDVKPPPKVFGKKGE